MMAKGIPQTVPIRILLVDPDAIVTESLSELLRHQGYGVEWANSADEALTKAIAFKPHVLIIEPHLRSSIEGIGLSNVLVATYPRVQVIFLTAWEIEIQFSIKKPCGIISKPYNDEAVLDLVTRCGQKFRKSKSLLFY